MTIEAFTHRAESRLQLQPAHCNQESFFWQSLILGRIPDEPERQEEGPGERPFFFLAPGGEGG